MTMDETTRIKTDAEVLRTLLRLGQIAVGDVVAWADRQIETTESADDQLVEIAMSSKLRAHEVGNLLECVKGTADRERYLRSLFSHFAEQLERDPSQLDVIASMLYGMAADDDFAGLPATYFLIMVDDDENGEWAADSELVRSGLVRALRALSVNPHAEPQPDWVAPSLQGVPIAMTPCFSGVLNPDRIPHEHDCAMASRPMWHLFFVPLLAFSLVCFHPPNSHYPGPLFAVAFDAGFGNGENGVLVVEGMIAIGCLAMGAMLTAFGLMTHSQAVRRRCIVALAVLLGAGAISLAVLEWTKFKYDWIFTPLSSIPLFLSILFVALRRYGNGTETHVTDVVGR